MNVRTALSVLLPSVLALAGCARDRVIVDTQGVDLSRYEQDQAECTAYAEQVSTGGKVAKSAGFGAVVGAAVGAIYGDSQAVARSAASGGVVGGAHGVVSGEGDKDRVLRNCLRGRGYRVLN